MQVAEGGVEGELGKGGAPVESHGRPAGVIGEGEGGLSGLTHRTATKVEVVLPRGWRHVCVCVYVCMCACVCVCVCMHYTCMSAGAATESWVEA